MNASGPVVIKLGGEVVASPSLPLLAKDVVELAKKRAVILVHGGGAQASALQKRLGQEPIKIAGRRVTDRDALAVMKMVLAGELNVDLCAALLAQGGRPVGLHGASSCAIAAEKRPPRVYAGAGPEPIDFGFVGDVTGVNHELLALLTGQGFTPVLACLGANSDGSVYNINADIVATRVAVALEAQSLLLVSDVRGVLRDRHDPDTRIPRISVAEGKQLIEEGIVKDGMIAKLDECFSAIESGAKQVHILGKLAAGELEREAREPGSVGTVIVP